MKKVNVTRLSKPYISINGSFGGSQSWFQNIDNQKKGKRLKGFGCGLIGAGDILLYISDCHELKGKENVVDEKKYMDYILSIEKRYFHVLPKMGISGVFLAWGLNIYFLLHRKELKKLTGCTYRARWAVRHKRLIERIKEMLTNDIPVLIAIGPGFFRKNKITLYQEHDEGGKMVFKPATKTKDHYVMVTGIIESDVTMLEISSWGKKYYINFRDYVNYVKKNDNHFFSNILYIRKKRKTK